MRVPLARPSRPAWLARWACATLVAASFAVAGPAQAQSEVDRALAQLSEILGALSHLEPLCDRPPFSREDMEALLASEDLAGVRRSVLIDAFNRGFRGAATSHQRCTATSERLIDRHHERGAAIVFRLLDG